MGQSYQHQQEGYPEVIEIAGKAGSQVQQQTEQLIIHSGDGIQKQITVEIDLEQIRNGVMYPEIQENGYRHDNLA
ncbi:MAG TPA: hypothetical protein DEO95_10980 [Ruminococcaceae bacterium]|nr:hypothetical protein [Oscillospiraceae bacterium]